MSLEGISKSTLLRLPTYLRYLQSIPSDGAENISATAIASALSLNEVQVRKDLASVSSTGRPRVGYNVKDLIAQLKTYLGYDNSNDAVIIGAGKLGLALMDYAGFSDYGINIVAAFDNDPKVVAGNARILPVEKLPDLCRRMNIKIGIITVPHKHAQAACDLLVESGILAIWNFAPAHIVVPDGVLVQNENIAASLAILSKHLSERL